MRKDDAEILRGIQKNTKAGMKAIETLNDKIYNDDLAMQLSRQNLKYSELYHKATSSLLDGHAEEYRSGGFGEKMMVRNMQANSFFNTSTSHMAELAIRGSSRGMVDMCKTVNRHENARSRYVEMAKELVDFEEENILELKKYL